MAKEAGQESEAQSDAAGTGQELETETPVVDTSAEGIVKAAQAMEESAASKEAKPDASKEKEEKAAPYDQDPKWKSARAAEKGVTEILEAHGLGSIADLAEMIKGGENLQKLLGTRDAEQLTQDLQYADTHRRNLAHWEQQELLKADEGLDPDERADKYKKKYEDLQTEQTSKATEADRIKTAKVDIENYNDRVGKIVDGQDFDEGTANIAKLILGVDNPFNTVDISDPKAVRAMADNGVKKLGDFIKTIQQDAIDKYAAGKSEFTPISPTETSEGETKVAAIPKDPPKNESVEDGFARVNKQLLESMSGGVSP